MTGQPAMEAYSHKLTSGKPGAVHLSNFIGAYNLVRRSTLKGLTPYEIAKKAWTGNSRNLQTRPTPSMPQPNEFSCLKPNSNC